MSTDPYAEEFVPEAKRTTRVNVRCGNCGRLLAEKVTAPWRIKCSRCKCVNESAALSAPARSLGGKAMKRVAAARRGDGRQQ